MFLMMLNMGLDSFWKIIAILSLLLFYCFLHTSFLWWVHLGGGKELWLLDKNHTRKYLKSVKLPWHYNIKLYFWLFGLFLSFVFLSFCLDITPIKCLRGFNCQKSIFASKTKSGTHWLTDWPRSGIALELPGQLKQVIMIKMIRNFKLQTSLSPPRRMKIIIASFLFLISKR